MRASARPLVHRPRRLATAAVGLVLSLLAVASISTVAVQPARASTPAPSWWDNTTCDTANDPGSYALGASYNGVQTCGPLPGSNYGQEVSFGVGTGEYEWQCVELSMRYMYLVYGITPYYLTGGLASNIVTDYSGSVLTKETDPTTDGLPTPGDILAFSYDHTAVVTSVSVNASGKGTIGIMQQNATSNGWGTVPVSDNVVGGDVSGWLHNPSYSAPSDPPPPALLGILTGGNIYAKVGLDDSWSSALNPSAASSIQLSGTRITWTDSSGNLYAKDWTSSGGFGNSWYDEYGPVTQYAASSSLLVILTGGKLYGKVNLTDPWTELVSSGATNVQVSGNRITYTDTSGNVWAKDGLTGTWYEEYGTVTQYAASSTLLVILTGGELWGKVNLTDPWTELASSGVSNVQVSGNRITYTDTSGNVWAKDGLTGTWYEEYGTVTSYAASSTVLAILTGGNIYAKNALTDSWSVALNPSTASNLQVSGDRITWTDSSGDVFAKDWDSTNGFGNPWYQEYGPVTAYSASG